MIIKKQYNSKIQQEQLIALVTQEKNLQARHIEQIKTAALKYYGNDWIQFFIVWRDRTLKDHRETIEKLEHFFHSQEERSKEILEKQEQEANRVLIAQKLELEQVESQLQQLTAQLNEVQRKEFERELQEKESLEKRARFTGRKRKPLRDAATSPELNHAISIAKKRNYHDEFVRSRDIVALFILFATGVRISNILQCTANNLNAFLEKGVFSIPAIKTRKNQEIRIPITTCINDLALEHKMDFERVCEGKEGNQKVMTRKGFKNPINRSVFGTRINSILRETSKKFKKNITSHSFRIGQVSGMINCGGIHQAQQLIGHSDIRTTSLYSRNLLSHTAALKLYEKLDIEKSQKVPRQWKKNLETFPRTVKAAESDL